MPELTARTSPNRFVLKIFATNRLFLVFYVQNIAYIVDSTDVGRGEGAPRFPNWCGSERPIASSEERSANRDHSLIAKCQLLSAPLS